MKDLENSSEDEEVQYQVNASSLSSLSLKHQPKRLCKTESFPDSDITSDSEIYEYQEDLVSRTDLTNQEDSDGLKNDYDTAQKWTL